MAEFKLVIGDTKEGKSHKKELKDTDAQPLLGKKLGQTIKGELFDMTGYEFKITGGSDKAGFPMRSDVEGTQRKKILAIKGVGLNNKKKYRKKTKKGKRTMNGMRTRKTVAGNTISEITSQINLKVLKYGKDPLEPKPEAAPEQTEGDAKAEAPKEESKPKEAPKE
ncbi:30S ribosomal protein S6e [Candidatus Woesearchaeota archaeon]|nr:30S ribosomal protein S6e [Candidatus Woesearchaeota archaeon]MBT3537928.1 30S ribosomal protein S6e [Candidatus Woesearchaeota archaeon]MBT4698066.1 30S ribosomal protein S6e [Candidatus Woesearchaeota archaeon]MBT4716521.1 30S ribosomal protein S6e [Candidatus Woesearchaeota archaeon]MBT7105597.1 30S ribosomal protein S6e [Candidatus Woesearchaeota archaeon]